MIFEEDIFISPVVAELVLKGLERIGEKQKYEELADILKGDEKLRCRFAEDIKKRASAFEYRNYIKKAVPEESPYEIEKLIIIIRIVLERAGRNYIFNLAVLLKNLEDSAKKTMEIRRSGSENW